MRYFLLLNLVDCAASVIDCFSEFIDILTGPVFEMSVMVVAGTVVVQSCLTSLEAKYLR